MGLLGDLLFGSNEKTNKENELKKYGLDDIERKEVEKGDYNPWNFEEEDLEEDDYYVEDDDVDTSIDYKNSSKNVFDEEDEEDDY